MRQYISALVLRIPLLYACRTSQLMNFWALNTNTAGALATIPGFQVSLD